MTSKEDTAVALGFTSWDVTLRLARACDVNVTSRAVDMRLVARLFFFQAEDGIRDLTVTGVQTCALPISADEPPVALLHVGRKSDCLVRQPAGGNGRVRSQDAIALCALFLGHGGVEFRGEIGRASCRERV